MPREWKKSVCVCCFDHFFFNFIFAFEIVKSGNKIQTEQLNGIKKHTHTQHTRILPNRNRKKHNQCHNANAKNKNKISIELCK